MDTSAVINVNVQSNDTPQAQYKTVVLKPNMVDDVNTLTQAMLTAHGQNTKFVIKYDYTLGEDITVPSGCILDFDGGSLSGAYTLTGANTGIEAGLTKIFNTNVTLAGTWNVVEAYPEWFGAKVGIGDSTLAIQKTIDNFNKTVLNGNHCYHVSPDNNNVCIYLRRGKSLYGTMRSANATVHNYTIGFSGNNSIGILCEGDNTLAHISLIGENTITIDQVRSYNCIGVKVLGSCNTIENVVVRNVEIGFHTICFMTSIKNCLTMSSKVGFYCKGYNISTEWYNNGDTAVGAHETSLTLINCYAMTCSCEGFVFFGISYSSLINCAADGCGCPIDGQPVDSASKVLFPYYFSFCVGITVISCGMEVGGKIVAIYRCVGMDILNCTAALGYQSHEEGQATMSGLIRMWYSSGIHFSHPVIGKYDHATIAQYEYVIITDSFVVIDIATSISNAVDNLLLSCTQISDWSADPSISKLIVNLDRPMTGDTTNRPSKYEASENTIYFDTTLGKPVFRGPNDWVDATGATV